MKELITIQAELKAPKNQENKFGGYNYRSAEDILEAVKKILPKVGCYLTITDNIEVFGERVYIAATATLTNSEGKSISTKAYAREAAVRKGQDESQITGSTSSYARKYALNGLFCIDDTKDPDVTNKHGKEEAQPLDVAGMVLDIMSSANLDEIKEKWGKYKQYDGEEKKIAKAVSIRRKELGV